jgi:hypothetical protein
MKIFKKGAYIVIENNNTINEYNSQFLQIEKYAIGLNAYDITYNGGTVAKSVLLSDIKNENGTAYTANDFDVFRLNSLGKENLAESIKPSSISIANPSGPYNSLSPVVLNYVLIPAGTFSSGSVPRVDAIFKSTSAVVASSYAILYVSSAIDLSGTNYAIGVLDFPALSRILVPLTRTLSIIDEETDTTYLSDLVTNVPNDLSLATAAAFASSSIDWTIDQYILAAGFVANAANSIESISIKVSL